MLLGPLRANAVVLAKQALSVHALSGGRLTLGIGLGGREDDYEFAGIEIGTRGKELDAMLERMKEVWDGDEIGPRGRALPASWSAASVDASFERAARFGDGWIAGGAPPEQFAEMATRSRPPGRRPAARASRGDGASPTSRSATTPRRTRSAYLTDYYAWLGEEVAGLHRRQRRQGRRDRAAATSPPSRRPAATS